MREMTGSKKTMLRGIALALIILFGTGPLSSVVRAEPGKPLAASFRETNREAALEKIEPALTKAMASGEKAGVIIYLKEKLNSAALAEATRESLTKSMTPYRVNQAVSRKVVEALKGTAETSQADLLTYLSQQEEKGTVLTFESFYAVNAVYAEADAEVIEEIAFRSEVKALYKNEKHQYIDPMISKDAVPAQEDLEWNVERVKANLAWDLDIEGTGVVVANMDTGVEWTHPALMNKWRGYDPVTGETDPTGNWFDAVYGSEYPEDPHGHGTHTMGTIVGQEPDGSNKIGVAPGATWIATRILDDFGYGSEVDILRAAQWILAPEGNADLQPDIVNNSWGGGPGIDDWFRDAVINWRASGILPVFSAGNAPMGETPSPGSIAIPANYPESFAVAATDSNNLRGSFSLLGPSPYDTSLIKPEVSAPGVNIRSSVPGGGYQGGWDGTSMAAPAVTGAAALLLSADQSLTVDELQALLMDTAVALTDNRYPTSPNFGYGYGLVDSFEAVASVADGTGFVTGQVLIEGSDTELPVIIHEQVVFQTFRNNPVTIQAGISDDVSVVAADVLARPEGAADWTVIPMKRVEGDHKDGNWQGIITPELFLADTMEYRIRATDYDGNQVLSDMFRFSLSFGILPGYTEGFETDAFGWTFSGDWEFGPSVEGFDPPAYEGDNLAGTILGGLHSEVTTSWMITPPLDLRDDSSAEATLRFHHWYATAGRYAYGQVMVSNDEGATWTPVSPRYFGSGTQWQEAVVDLSAYVGSTEPVYVGFLFESNWWSLEGWYVDDVQLVGEDSTAPEAPTELTANTALGGVSLSWFPSPDGDVVKYEVLSSDASGGPFTLLAETRGTRYLDATAPLNETRYYVVRAVDLSGNASENSNEAWGMAKSYAAIFGSDFEDDDGGLISGAEFGENDWEWGELNSGPRQPWSGDKLWATNLDGDYLPESQRYIMTPSLELPLGSRPILTFAHWLESEGNEYGAVDYGMVEISNDDGVSWTNITPTSDGFFGGRIRTWIQEEIPLGDYEGSTVQIRFNFYSDYDIEYYGWYIDDLYVMGLEEESQAAVKTPEEELQGVEAMTLASPLSEPEASTENPPEYQTMTNEEVEAIPNQITGIPAQGATVTVLESGRTVRTNPATGEYSLRMRVGEYTLVAEAYGYIPKEAAVTIEEDQTTEVSFLLLPMATGEIRGRVVDRYYGNPAAYAELRLVEDPNVRPVTADEEGYFSMTGVLVGDYTLRASADGFEPGLFPVSVEANAVVEVELGLKRFVGYSNQIIYDDGTAEDALILYDPPNGVANRFTPDQYAMVAGANIYLWDDSFPQPGGNRLGFNIYGIDENGLPYPVGKPIFRDDLNRGEWNYIDLSSYRFATEGDFFISTVQDQPGERGPAVGLDYDSPYGYRAYLNISGDFVPLEQEGFPGVFMIRAVMLNSVSTPVFTNLTDVNYTNQDVITVEGSMTTDGTVNIYLNGEKKVMAESAGGVFSAEVPLPLTENILMATAELDGVETEPSPEVLVIKDQTKPELTVTAPEDGFSTNTEVIRVIGTATDEHMSEVLVNGEAVALGDNGEFNHRIFLDPGENLITIEALDLAGNVTTEERTVTVQTQGIVIQHPRPAVNLEVEAGDTVTFSFRSPTIGGEASYAIMLPLGAASVGRTPMTEVEPGLYSATWTVPQNLSFRGAQVSFQLLDGSGNRAEALAPGTISIGITAIQRIAGANRYQTSVEASKAAFKSADTVILASGGSFPDSMAGAPLAAVYEAPILLTTKGFIPVAVLAEIERLGASRVILLGGELVISTDVETQLAAYDVERITGSNRFLTAVKIGERVVEATGSNTAILVNGTNFPDGLSVGPAAAIHGNPILFCTTDEISQETLDALMDWEIENITIIGGNLVVSKDLKDKLTGLGYSVNRIAGDNRFDTALQVARTMFDNPDQVVIASGEDFPDALAGGPLATRYDAPILLTAKDSVSPSLLKYLKDTGVRKAFILGGNLVISDNVIKAIEDVIK